MSKNFDALTGNRRRSASIGLVCHHTRLTHADICALPTTPFVVVPGCADRFIVPVIAAVRLTRTGNVLYTNISEFSTMRAFLIRGMDAAAQYDTDNITTAADLLTLNGASTSFVLTPVARSAENAAALGADISVLLDNIDGDLTGGNLNDTLDFTVWYGLD